MAGTPDEERMKVHAAEYAAMVAEVGLVAALQTWADRIVESGESPERFCDQAARACFHLDNTRAEIWRLVESLAPEFHPEADT